MDRVELIVQLTGAEDAVRSLQRIKTEMNALKNTKVQLQIDKYQLDREIAELNRRIRELTHERRQIQLDHGNLGDIDQRIQNLRDELNELVARRNEIMLDIKGIDHAVAGLKAAGDELGTGSAKADEFAEALGRVGSVMQSIGGGLTKAGGFFTSISHMFDSNIVDTMQRYATVMTTRLFAQNWGKATERFDILSTYADYLEMVGVSAEEADASLEKINSKIQGIPVGLSDVAYQTRMYQMYLNDMERATNLAIGLNRALIAGGANQQMRNTAQYEIDRLLATGTLSTSRQWRSLMQGLGVSGRFLREAMGYGDMSQNEFISQLFTKQISGDEFLRGIEKLADSGALNQALDIYRTTIESGLSNIYFALTRGKANILSALDSSLMEGTGKDISGWLYEIRDAINEVYKAAASWISENPELLAQGIDSIISVFERLAAFDWGGLAEGVATGVGQYINILTGLYDAINTISPDAFEDFITFAMVWAGPIGTSLRLLGSAVTALGNAFKFLKEHTSVLSFLVANAGDIALFGGAFAGFGLMMAGYAEEAKNAEYALRDYAAAIDEVNALGKFENRLSSFAESKNEEELEKELQALKRYQEEQERILFDLWDLREELQSGGIDFTLDENGLLGEDAQALAELNGKIHENQTEVEGAIALYEQYKAKLDAITQAKQQAAMSEAFPEGMPDISEEQLQKLSQLVGLWTELRDAAEQAIEKQIAGFKKIDEVTAVGVGDITEILQSQTDALNSLAENLGGIDSAAKALAGQGFEAQGEALSQIAGEIAGMGLDGAGFAKGINDALEEAFETDDWSAIDKLIAVWQERLDAKDAAIDMTAFAEMFAENFRESLETAFDNLEGFGGVGDLLFGTPEDIENLDIQPIADAAIKKMEELKSAITDGDTDILALFGDEGDDQSLPGGIAKIDAAFKLLIDETIPLFSESIASLAEAVSTFATDSETALVTAAQNAEQRAIEAINNIIAALDRLKAKITETANHAISELQRVIAVAKEAVAAIKEIEAALMALDGTHVTVYIDVVGGEIPAAGGGGEGGATGGLFTAPGKKPMYYKKGGWVFMKPQGTDTVPAMLTPGEYVMRRGAVDQLGVPFLQRLNRLDIAGALDNLMHRFYRPSQASYSVVNNSADNRAYTVTQNIYTNNPDYTYHVAARFARAI